MNIEKTVQKINDLIDSANKDFKPHEVMQLSQAALNLAHVKATIAATNREDRK
jgi:hypothetical protein